MDWRQEEALWRYSLIREAADPRLSCGERGALVRSLAARLHAHPSGELRSVGRSTLDDWVRAYRTGGFAGLAPRQRASVPRTPRALLLQAEVLRRENPARTAAQIQRIIAASNGGVGPSQSTVERHLRRQGLTRAALTGERQAFGRFEASGPNERWIADCLHGPMIEGRRAILFCVLDDHSRAVVGAGFAHAESTVRLEGVLRSAFQARGLCARLYVDNGAPYASRQLARVCAALGIRLTHSTPGRPQGRGKIERFFRTLRQEVLVELDAHPRLGLTELERVLQAWIEQVYHRRVHSETKATPLERLGAFTPRYPTAAELREAFLWSETRLVTKTATVSLLGNRYEVDQALCGRRVELRFDPYDLELIEVYYAGRPCGHAVGHVIGRHVHPHAEEPAGEPRPVSGIDYLRLITEEHERDWLSRRINYHQLHAVNDAGDSDGDVEHGDDDTDDGAAAAAVR
ncbi:MAG: transposase [Solirubrobacteraceae bacterium]